MRPVLLPGWHSIVLCLPLVSCTIAASNPLLLKPLAAQKQYVAASQSEPNLKSQRVGDPLQLKSGSAHTASLSFVDAGWFDPDRYAHMSEESFGLVQAPPFRCFEVNVPPRTLPDERLESSTTKLLYRSFGNSYFDPEIVDYSPALLQPGYRDPSRWVSITLVQEGRSRGRQFDRLGSVFLANDGANGHGVEVWRTDNPQPVNTTGGIIWKSEKEVNTYFDLFSKPGTLVFDYPNIVNEMYTGALNITLSLTVTQLKGAANIVAQIGDSLGQADSLRPLGARTPLVYPISKHNTTGDSKWLINGEKAVANIRVPRNAAAALVEVYASGTAEDEFWYTGAPDAVTDKIVNATDLFSLRGPYRELQVRIDGHLAGIAHPSPVIFTGGLNPLLWRPQVGFGALNQPSYTFDVTPFLSLLTDGAEHAFSLHVLSAEKNESIPNSWFVSGNLQVAVDDGVTWGDSRLPTIEEDGSTSYSIEVTGTRDKPKNVSIEVKTTGPRTLTVLSERRLADGRTQEVSVKQNFEFLNTQKVDVPGQFFVSSPARTLAVPNVVAKKLITPSSPRLLFTRLQHINQLVSGSQLSTHGDNTFLSTRYQYPLKIDISPATEPHDTGNGSLPKISVDRSFFSETKLSGLVPSSKPGLSQWPEPERQTIDTRQVGNADGRAFGKTGQEYSYSDSWGNSFYENVEVQNRTVTHFERSGNLAVNAGPVK